MHKKVITIIGCGTLGSAVAYSLALRSLDSDINKLYLIDDDVLEIKNLPYLFMVDHLHQNIHKPKVMILKSILKQKCLKLNNAEERNDIKTADEI